MRQSKFCNLKVEETTTVQCTLQILPHISFWGSFAMPRTESHIAVQNDARLEQSADRQMGFRASSAMCSLLVYRVTGQDATQTQEMEGK